MKTGQRFLLLLLFLSVYFIFPSNVFADVKKIGTCTYELPDEFGVLSGFKLAVTIYDDKTTTRKASIGDKVYNNTDLHSGLLIGDTGMYTQYSKMFNTNGRYYKEYETRKGCPSLQFIWYLNQSQLHFDMIKSGSSSKDPDNNPSKLITSNMTGTSSNSNVSKRTVVCNRTKRISHLGYEMKFTFIKENGKKVLEISRAGTDDVLGVLYPDETNITSFNGITFQVKSEDISNFWKNETKCKEAFYLEALNGDYNNLQIQKISQMIL